MKFPREKCKFIVTLLLSFLSFVVLHLTVLRPYLLDHKSVNFIPVIPFNLGRLSGSTLISKTIFVATTWRSGSTFLGDIIKSIPGVFYSFEPLLYLDHHPGSKTELIQSLFHCRFSHDYLQSTNGLTGLPNDMQRNKRVWDECSYYNRTLCHDPEFVGNLCSNFPIHIIKTVWLRVEELSALIENDPLITKEWKIIHLIRDPRGIMASSRAGLGWCQVNPACNNVSRLCAELEDDVELTESLVKRFPNRHYLLKFEDMTSNVEIETDKLFRFL